MTTLLIAAAMLLNAGESPQIHRTVVDSDGRPLEGVDVFLAAPGVADGALDVARTDVQGAFVVSFPSEKATPGHCTVLAYRPGWAVGGASIANPAAEHDPLRIAMTRPVETTLTVLAPEGQPLRNAVIEPETIGSVGFVTVGFNRPTPTGPVWIQPPPGLGRLTRRTDAEGHFEVPALGEGETTVRVEIDRRLPFRLEKPAAATLRAGETATVALALAKGVKLSGRVIDAASKAPVAGAEVAVSDAGGGSERVITGDDGAFVAVVGPGQVQVNLLRVPLPYFRPIQDWRVLKVEPGVETFTVEPFALPHGVPLTGEVVDEKGRLVPDAWVNASWRFQEGSLSTMRGASARSDAQGRFTLAAVGRDVEINVWADIPNRASREATSITPGNTASIRLIIAPEGVVPFTGRVVDRQGEPVSGAKIVLRGGARTVPGAGDWLIGPEFDNQWEMTSDAEGRFAAPHPLHRHWTYTMSIEAPSRVAYQNNELTIPAGAARWVLPDVILDRMVTLRGAVVDRQGKPVDKATVSAPHASGYGQMASAVCDERGAFELPQVHPAAKFLFVEASGFRFHGMAIPRGEEPLRIVLTREEESPDEEPLTTQRLPEPQRRELLQKLLTAVFEKGQQTDSDYTRSEALLRLAPYDPAFVSARLETIRSVGRRSEVLLALGRLDEALLTAEAAEEVSSRVYIYRSAADRADGVERKLQILAQAMAHVRMFQEPTSRVTVLAGIAEQLYDLNQRDAARNLVDEALPLAQELATTERPGFVRGYFAETLALFDQEAALELIKDVGKNEDLTYARHRGNIAHELAAINPAAAERILQQIADKPHEYGRYAPRVGYRMAPVDLERAQSIAAGIQSPETRAWAFGVMARAMAEPSSEDARRLLRQAFEQLASIRAEHQKRQAFPVAMCLVRVAELADPVVTRECFWRAVSLDPGPGAEPYSEKIRQVESDSRLSMLLSLYGVEPEAARELAQGSFEYAQTLPPSQYVGHNGIDSMITAMALADPERTIAWHSGYLANATAKDLNYVPQAFKLIADALGKPPEELWNQLQDELLHVWVVDKEDQ